MVWKSQDLIPGRKGGRTGTSESRNGEVAPQHRARGKAADVRIGDCRDLTASPPSARARGDASLQLRPAHPPSGSVPAARAKAAGGSAIGSADRAGEGRRPLCSRSSRPGPAAPGRLQPRAARSLTLSLAPRQVVLPTERPRPCRPHRRCSAEAESGPPLP